MKRLLIVVVSALTLLLACMKDNVSERYSFYRPVYKTRDEVKAKMQHQIQEEIKMRLCDFVIINDEQQLLIPQVLKLHERFLAESKESDIQ